VVVAVVAVAVAVAVATAVHMKKCTYGHRHVAFGIFTVRILVRTSIVMNELHRLPRSGIQESRTVISNIISLY
jgi:hypothetical protein